MGLVAILRNQLRTCAPWVEFQEINREGWIQAWRRFGTQRKILKTHPVRTAKSGPIEIRVLTWRRDWLNAIWALKSFYHYATVDYPLFIHDGGLKPNQKEKLQYHFPDATLISEEEAEEKVVPLLEERRLYRSIAYRRRNITTRKLFDFFLLSKADVVISVDSDIIFFKRPSELLDSERGKDSNLYHKDMQYSYTLKPDELEAAFGIRPISMIACGLSRVHRESVDFEKINLWLEHPKLFEDRWVTEQTLHALCATIYGAELLPDTYLVSTERGMSPELVCKHYPGFFRPLLYQEGMAHLVKMGFISHLVESAKERRRT
jgi:hypothetical protein